MTRYKVIVSKHVGEHLLEHISFISNVSLVAARDFISEYEEIINRLEDNPYEFQVDTSFENTYGYRRAIFAKWYKCLFVVEESVVYVDYIVDCRQENY